MDSQLKVRCTYAYTHCSNRSPLCIPFLALPSRAEIPDYYEQIKTPLSLEQIRRRLQARQYGTLEDVRNALETVWRNAKRYNLKGSEIYEQARTLHVRAHRRRMMKRIYA